MTEYVNLKRAQKTNREYVGEKADRPSLSNPDYHPTDILGRCLKCGCIGTLDFPPGAFKWKIGDNIMSYSGTVDDVVCQMCSLNEGREVKTEWRTIGPDEYNDEQLAMIRRSQEQLIEDLYIKADNERAG